MRILAIESSCDETAAAVVEDGRRALSNVIATQVEEHKLYGGVVPEIASRRHAEAVSGVVKQALFDAGLTLQDIDAVGVTYAPGLIGALLVGVNYAKSLSYAANLPLVPVHHLRGHIAANYLCHPALQPPFLCLVVSGGHTHLTLVKDYCTFEVLGKTRDDAAGEALDKAARAMGLPYPGGLHLDKIAKDGDPQAFRFPVPHVDGAPLDFSFSGLKTSVLNTLHNAKQKGETIAVPDLGASFLQSVVRILCNHTEQAALQTGQKTIVLAGGVSANSVLRRDMEALCRRHGWHLYAPDLPLCGDNAAMIGAQAFYEYNAGVRAPLSLNAVASMPLDTPTL